MFKEFRMRKFILVCALGFSGLGLAEDESKLADFGAPKNDGFKYGMSKEVSENAKGNSVSESWASAHSGHLTAGINNELNKYRLHLNANGGELFGLQNSEVGKNLLNKIQVEAGAATNKASYGLLAMELPVVKPITLFLGTVHSPGGAQRFLLGPIVYYGNSSSLLFWYPKGAKSVTPVDHALVLRNRIREFKGFWLDADMSYKMVAQDEAVESFSPYGYGLAMGVWKVYGKYAVSPYDDGNKILKTSYEVGVDAAF